MADGTITRKEIIADDAINWGAEYSKVMDGAIAKNKEFVDGIIAINEANKQVRQSNSQKEYVANQKIVNDETRKTLGIWKEQNQLETALISTKKKRQLVNESTNVALQKERLLLAESNKEIKIQAKETLGLVSHYQKLSARRLEAQKTLANLLSAEKLNNAEIRKAQIEFEKLDVRVKAVDSATKNYSRNIGNYQSAFNGLGTSVRSLVSAFGLVTGVALFGTVIRDAFNQIKEFEEEIVNLAAIAGLTRKQIAPLEDGIREVARTSINTAGDVAKLATALIKLGSSPEEALRLLKPVNDLSIAMRADAEEAAELVKGLLNAYGEDAAQAARVTDVLAAAANKSALSFQGLRDSFGYVAPAARALGYSVEQTASFLSVLVDNNIKAESAGRLLSTSFARLAKQGVTLENALDQINKKQKEGASSLDVLAFSSKLFGVESAKIGLILANNRTKINELTEAYNNAGGSLEELTNKQLESASAKIKILTSAWQEFVLSIEDGQGPISRVFTGLIDNVTEFLGLLSKANKENNFNTAFNDSKMSGEKAVLAEIEAMKQQKKTAEEINETAKLKLDYAIQQRSEIKLNVDSLMDEEKANLAIIKTIDDKKKANESLSFSEGRRYYRAKSELKETREQLKAIGKLYGFQDGVIKGAKSILQPAVAGSPENVDPNETQEEETKKQKDAYKKFLEARKKYWKEMYEIDKKAKDDAYKLMQQRLQVEIDLNKEILSSNDSAFDDKLEAMESNNNILSQKLKESLEYDLKQLGKYNEDSGKFLRDISDEEIKSLISTGTTKKQLNDEQLRLYERYQADVTAIASKAVTDRSDLIDQEVADIKKRNDALLLSLNTKENQAIEAENKLFQLAIARGDDLEDAERQLQERILAIKRDFAKQGLDLQIKAIEDLLVNQDKLPIEERISAKERAKIDNELSELKRRNSEIDTENVISNADVVVKTETEKWTERLQIAEQASRVLQDLTNAIFDNRIQKIDDEINKNNEKYSVLLEAAKNDERQRELLEKERDLRNAELEKKKRKEQVKQAIFDKVMTASQVAIRTALAVITALAAFPGIPYTIPNGILAGSLGAIQLAAVLAAPIPKYASGRKGGKAEIAYTGDGGRREVVERPDGSAYLTPNVATLTMLGKGDKVYSSEEAYKQRLRNSILQGFRNDNQKVAEFHNHTATDKYGAESLSVMKDTLKAIRNQKFPIYKSEKIDINHHLWKMGNTNWK